jgi:DNA repair exonuclease SbcCD ATPase subunit
MKPQPITLQRELPRVRVPKHPVWPSLSEPEKDALKQRIKALQKDLAEVREENKALTQFDPVRMKKNLDASKKKLAEKTAATDLLQKTLSETKKENAELKRKVAELEARVAELEARVAELAPEDAEQVEAKEESVAA